MARPVNRVLAANAGLLLTAALVAWMLIGAAATARPTRLAKCPPPGASLIAGNGVVRVYVTAPVRIGRASAQACLVRRGTRMTLVAASTPGQSGLHKSIGMVALAGSVVAYVEGQFGIDSGCIGIRVADVATRRVLRGVPKVGCSVDAGLLRREVVTSLVVGPDGGVAWMLEREAHALRSPRTVLVYSLRAGAPAVLDEGPDIGATSLSLSSGTLSWWHAGVRHAAAITP